MKKLLTKRALLSFPKLGAVLVMMFMTSAVFAQINVSGVVTEAGTGQTLPSVTVLIKGTTNGTFTNVDGRYQISANSGDTLVFSFVGFETVERAVTGSTINVEMGVSSQALGEVVVIGYGTTSVKDATGSIAAISTEDFNKGNIVTPENLLNGRVSGVQITQGGEPGAGATIRIRGGASLGASNDPLIVINGLPIDNSTVGGGRSILSTLNPNEIESFTVLKDASATAIYGSRASNGVIIITTKEARNDFSVNLDIQTNVSELANTYPVFTADELRDVLQQRRPDLVGQLGTANTNWQEEIYRTGVSSNINLSAEGSLFGKVPTRVSVGRTFQEGIRLTSEFDRTATTLNAMPSFFKDALNVQVNFNYTREENRFASGQEGNAISFDPTQPVYDPNSPFGGFFQFTNLVDDGVLNEDDLIPFAPFNPVAELLQTQNLAQVDRVFGNIKFDYQLPWVEGLTATLNLGYDEQKGQGTFTKSNLNPQSIDDGSIVGTSSSFTSYRVNRLLDGYFSYVKEFTPDLNFDATAGYSYQKFEAHSSNTGNTLDPNAFAVSNAETDVVLIGYFARANVAFKNKYYLTASFRRDGSSRFSEDNRWGNFPAAAISWKLNEDLFPNNNTVSTLKLRVGWGITGQQDIGSASGLYLNTYSVGQDDSQYRFGNQVIPIGQPQFRNEIIKWEETTTTNIGVDFGLFNDRLYGSIEYFNKNSEDLLAFAAISDGSNFSNGGFQNIGDFTTQGVEFAISGDIIQSSDFSWSGNFNATFIGQEINELALGADQLIGGISGGVGNTVQIHRVGFAPFMFHLYKQVYGEDGKPIEGAYADLNGDNVINLDDRYLHRNGIPDVTMGFLSNFNYKNWDLSFNLRASLGNYVYNNVASTRAQFANFQLNNTVSNLPTSVLDSEFNITEDVILSDYYLENASFLRLDNVTLGYRFNKIPIKGVKSLRLSGGAMNLFVITNYSGVDPEVFNNGIDNTIYPRARTYYLSLNVGF